MGGDRGGVSSGCEVARGRSSEAKSERFEVEKSKCGSVVVPPGVEPNENGFCEHGCKTMVGEGVLV